MVSNDYFPCCSSMACQTLWAWLVPVVGGGDFFGQKVTHGGWFSSNASLTGVPCLAPVEVEESNCCTVWAESVVLMVRCWSVQQRRVNGCLDFTSKHIGSHSSPVCLDQQWFAGMCLKMQQSISGDFPPAIRWTVLQLSWQTIFIAIFCGGELFSGFGRAEGWCSLKTFPAENVRGTTVACECQSRSVHNLARPSLI